MPKNALKVSDIEEHLRKLNGNVAAVARALGYSRTAIHKKINESPNLQQVCHECREAMKDNAESSLYRAVLDGESWAVCFYLKTQAKDRGYIEKTQSENHNTNQVTTEMIVTVLGDTEDEEDNTDE